MQSVTCKESKRLLQQTQFPDLLLQSEFHADAPCRLPEPDESSPHPPNLFPYDQFWYYPPIYA
jgi:hypothetical protein